MTVLHKRLTGSGSGGPCGRRNWDPSASAAKTAFVLCLRRFGARIGAAASAMTTNNSISSSCSEEIADGFYPDDAYAAIDEVVADLIAARERVKQCEAMLLTMRTHIIEILDD